MRGGQSGRKWLGVAAAVLGVVQWACYAASHILSAVLLFRRVELWLFLAVLLVPGLGDVAGIVLLIENRLLLPLVLYLASAAAHGFGLLLARRVEQWE